MKTFLTSFIVAAITAVCFTVAFLLFWGGGTGVFNARQVIQKSLVGVAAHEELVKRFGAAERDLNIQIDALRKDVEAVGNQAKNIQPERLELIRNELALRDRLLGERRNDLLKAANVIKAATDKQIAALLNKAAERVAAKRMLGCIVDATRAGVPFVQRRLDVTDAMVDAINEAWTASGGRFIDLPETVLPERQLPKIQTAPVSDGTARSQTPTTQQRRQSTQRRLNR